MLVVVVATVLAVQMTTEQQLAVTRVAAVFDNQQAREYAYGGEELARQILYEDFVETAGKDHLLEAWASPELAFEFEDGEVELRIEDLQGRINVNALAAGQGAALARSRLATLVGFLGVDPMFVDRIADWVDQNQGKSQIGAEDFDYLGLERPYRAANQPLAAITELRLLLDMDSETYERLSPYVSALPDPNAHINVNTALPETLVALAPQVSIETAEAIAAQRDAREGYDDVQSFLAEPGFAGLGLGPEGLGVQSAFFQVSVRARYHDRFAYLTSIIQRDLTDGSMRVIYRDLSRKIYPVVAAEAGASEDDNG